MWGINSFFAIILDICEIKYRLPRSLLVELYKQVVHVYHEICEKEDIDYVADWILQVFFYHTIGKTTYWKIKTFLLIKDIADNIIHDKHETKNDGTICTYMHMFSTNRSNTFDLT